MSNYTFCDVIWPFNHLIPQVCQAVYGADTNAGHFIAYPEMIYYHNYNTRWYNTRHSITYGDFNTNVENLFENQFDMGSYHRRPWIIRCAWDEYENSTIYYDMHRISISNESRYEFTTFCQYNGIYLIMAFVLTQGPFRLLGIVVACVCLAVFLYISHEIVRSITHFC